MFTILKRLDQIFDKIKDLGTYEEEIKNLAEDGSPMGMPEISGEIKMEEDFLVWNMSQENQEEAKEFKLFYKQRE